MDQSPTDEPSVEERAPPRPRLEAVFDKLIVQLSRAERGDGERGRRWVLPVDKEVDGQRQSDGVGGDPQEGERGAAERLWEAHPLEYACAGVECDWGEDEQHLRL